MAKIGYKNGREWKRVYRGYTLLFSFYLPLHPTSSSTDSAPVHLPLVLTCYARQEQAWEGMFAKAKIKSVTSRRKQRNNIGDRRATQVLTEERAYSVCQDHATEVVISRLKYIHNAVFII